MHCVQDNELLLVAPWGVEVDRVVWGQDAGLPIPEGASLERSGFGEPGSWVVAQSVWPGSAGDRGSPGAPYVSATPTPTFTSTSTPTATFTPTPVQATAVPTPTQTSSPTATAPPAVLPSLFISEFLADPVIVTDDAGE